MLEKVIITAKVKHLNKPNWIELYANDHYLGRVWGDATLSPRYNNNGDWEHMLTINEGDAYIHIDTIERLDEPVLEDLVKQGAKV